LGEIAFSHPRWAGQQQRRWQIGAALPRQIPDRPIPIENQMNKLAIVCCTLKSTNIVFF
jgi:hypothetical protein